jgi:hypothetical protein
MGPTDIFILNIRREKAILFVTRPALDHVQTGADSERHRHRSAEEIAKSESLHEVFS